MKRNYSLLALVLTALPARAADVPTVKHVAIVIFENANYSDVVRTPFFAELATKGALATQFLAETHPSQGNYVAFTSGDLHGVRNDSNIDLNVRHIGDLLEEAGKTWKVYAENYPGNCYTGAFSGDYARKHNPFISFTSVSHDAARCANIVDAGQLDRDIAAGTLPDYLFYVPNQKNDGHDTGIAYADRWFAGKFRPLLADRRFMDGTLLIATYDESGPSARNQIYTTLIGDMVRPGATYAAYADHYSLLKTVELALGLGDLGLSDATATPLSGIWQ
jgi:hypothetical protein